MLNLEFLILETINNQPFSEAHREILFKLDNHNINEIKSTIDDLIEFNLIEKVPCSPNYKLTTRGKRALRLEKKSRYKNTEQKEKQTFDNQISVANLLVPFVIFILGILVANFSKIISIISSLLH